MPTPKPQKPKKPYPSFPLHAHATGRWAAKIGGRRVYFGPWSDPAGALQKYLDYKDGTFAGRPPRDTGSELTIRDAVNQYLTSKQLAVDTGRLAPGSFSGYRRSCLLVVDVFGKNRAVTSLRPADFEQLLVAIAKGRGPVSQENAIRNIRVFFRWLFDSELIEKPVRFGPAFKAPAKREMRHARHAAGKRMFSADELRRILAAAERPIVTTGQKPTQERARHPMRAMVLLAVNAGLGATDLANLPQSALDLENGWVDFPRPKTGVQRRAPLWPETVAALQHAIANRPKPASREDRDCVFLTYRGRRFVRQKENVSAAGVRSWTAIDSVALQFGKLLRSLDLKRRNVNFYALRHTFRTVAAEVRDEPAASFIMGHAADARDMAAVYTEEISGERLRRVTNHVRQWLFGS